MTVDKLTLRQAQVTLLTAQTVTLSLSKGKKKLRVTMPMAVTLSMPKATNSG